MTSVRFLTEMNSFASSFETGFEGVYGNWSFGLLKDGFCLQKNHTFPVAHVTETSLSNLGYGTAHLQRQIYPDLPLHCKILSLRFPHPHQLLAVAEPLRLQTSLESVEPWPESVAWYLTPRSKTSPAVADVYGPERLMGWEYIV